MKKIFIILSIIAVAIMSVSCGSCSTKKTNENVKPEDVNAILTEEVQYVDTTKVVNDTPIN